MKNKYVILFLKSQIIILFYLITDIFILKKNITLNQYLFSIIFKKAIGNSNWFAFTIIVFYIYSYLSFGISKNNNVGIFINTIICIIHIIFVYNYFYPKKILPIETTLCFISGFYFSLFRKHFDKIKLNSDIFYFSITSFTICIYYKCYYIYNIFYRSIRNLSFALLIILMSMKIRLKNDFLKFLNSHSFSIYLLQRLVMMIVYNKHLFLNNNFIRISFEFTTIFFLHHFLINVLFLSINYSKEITL